jgi:hypothetical protein
MIRIVLSEQKVRNGEHLRGNVTWRAEGSKTPRKLDVVCRWRIEGKGKSRQEVVGSAGSENPMPEMVISFDFEIPIHGPLSYDGKLLRIIWEVFANADLPMARDENDVAAFTVVARRWNPEEWKEPEDEEVEET